MASGGHLHTLQAQCFRDNQIQYVIPAMAVYPRGPPDGPMSTINSVVPEIWPVVKGSHVATVGFGQLGVVLHSLIGSRARLTGCVVTK